MRMVYLPYICVSKERLEIIQRYLKELGYPELKEIALLNKVIGIRIVEGRREGFIAFTSKDIKEIEIMREKYGAFSLARFYHEGKYYFVTSIELKNGEII